MRDGLTPKEITRMCDMHVEIFRESVSGAEREVADFPEGHPLRTLYEENIQIIKDAEILNLYSASLEKLDETGRKNTFHILERITHGLKAVGYIHYNREEMILFPYIERRGLNAVPAVLWRKHDEIRAELNVLLRCIQKGKNYQKISELGRELASKLIDMVFRENNILYPTLKVLLSDGEFAAIRELDNEIGYYKVKPKDKWKQKVEKIYPYMVRDKIDPEKLMSLPQHLLQEMQNRMGNAKLQTDKTELVRKGDINLENGYMLPEEISAMLATMPVDITFIDSEDRVRFFSGGERIFTRTRSILGRPVQQCHPPKSVHIVNKILQAFKNGEKKKAKFWIDMSGRKILIQYFAVWKDKKYRGTIEFTMDITEVQKIKGEKRLLNWS